VALLVIAVGALLLFLPRLANSPIVRHRIETAAHDALGREFRYGDLTFGLFPPSLVVARPEVSGAKTGDPPFLEAEDIALRLAIAPLLARTVVIDSLVVQGAALRLVRTKEGIEIPKPPAAETGRLNTPVKPAESAEAKASLGFQLAVRDLRLRHARLRLEDRTVSPEVTWDLGNMNLDAHLDSLEGPITFDFSATLASGGKIHTTGTAGMDTDFKAEVELDRLVVDPLARYLGRHGKLTGALSGKVVAQGIAASPKKIEADLALREGDVRFGKIALRGTARVKLDLEGGFDRTRGRFEVDATEAEVRYGDAFTKPAGESSSVAGSVGRDANGNIEIKDARIRLKDLNALVSVRTGKRIRLQVSAPAFELAGWDRWLPALSGYDLQGPVVLRDLVVTTSPVELGGSVELSGISVRMPDREPFMVKGVLRGAGRSLRLDRMSLTAAEQVVNITGSVTRFDATPRYDLRLRTSQADSNKLLSAFSSLRDVLYGPLDLDARLRGEVGGKRRAIEALSATVRLDIGQGRLKGISILKSTFDRLGAIGEAALIAGRLRGGRTLQRFYEDTFESIAGTFEISSGQATTDNLELLYRHYKVNLWGTLGLLDRRLDMRGRLTIFKEIDKELAGAGTRPVRKTIPLARVVGTLDSPRVDLSPESVARFTSSYAIERRRGNIEEKIDEKLGKGSGKEVIDVIEGILGGGSPGR